MGLSAETIHIQRDHPIFQGGSSPHTVDGGLPTPPSLNVGGPRPAMPTGGDGVNMYGGAAPAPKKVMPRQMAERVAGENTQRANTAFDGQPGPIKREAGAQGYDTSSTGLMQAFGGNADGSNTGAPDIKGIGRKIGHGLEAVGESLGKTFGSAFGKNPEEQADDARRYQNYQADSAAVANARKYNR